MKKKKKKPVNKTKQTNKQDSNLISHLKKQVYDNEQWNNVNAKQRDYNSSYKAVLLRPCLHGVGDPGLVG